MAGVPLEPLACLEESLLIHVERVEGSIDDLFLLALAGQQDLGLTLKLWLPLLVPPRGALRLLARLDNLVRLDR